MMNLTVTRLLGQNCLRRSKLLTSSFSTTTTTTTSRNRKDNDEGKRWNGFKGPSAALGAGVLVAAGISASFNLKAEEVSNPGPTSAELIGIR